MKIKNALSLILTIAFFAVLLFSKYQDSRVNQEIDSNYNAAINKLDDSEDQNTLQSGYAEAGFKKLHQEKIQRIVKKRIKQDAPRIWIVDPNDARSEAFSAMGVDRKHHFANSYLVGFTPFETDKYWVPLYMLASRKLYQYDHLQYSGFDDIWQNSLQAFKNTRGDCEDHAIALADWLIGLGLDARVAIGDLKEEGHAWVIVFKDEKEYLLEATQKTRSSHWSRYRLAKTEHNYHPVYLFNRETLWVNTGSKYTVNYSGENWRQASTFHKDATI